jgi:hypothetical protein
MCASKNMKVQMKITILFLILAIQVPAQKLVFIPDVHLRNELKKEGLTINDSLNLSRIHGMRLLELNGKGIENLEGLQYFEQVWQLSIYNNKIKHLKNLPPNLTELNCAGNQISVVEDLPASITTLDCSSNQISEIERLPKNLKHLSCNNNKISRIENLPSTLISLNFRQNLMQEIPVLPKNLQHINYADNPIPFSNLPKSFQNISCDHPAQNCLPYQLMNWKILDANIQDTLFNITSMTLELTSNYDGGDGSQIETVNFHLENNRLAANQMKKERHYDKNIAPHAKNTIRYSDVQYAVEVDTINQFLKDIYANKMSVQIQTGDSLISINLANKKNGRICLGGCGSHCTMYHLQYTIYSNTNTIKLSYVFSDTAELAYGPQICSTDEPEDLKLLLDWLYIYKLASLTFSKQEVMKQFLDKTFLHGVANWAK